VILSFVFFKAQSSLRMNQIPKDYYVIRDFSWTSKFVTSPDCSPTSLQPLIQVHLYCEGSNQTPSGEPLIFEFTPTELQTFIDQCSKSLEK
jgi:hypothetical protein